MKKVIFALSLLIAMAFSACEEEGGNETVISTFGLYVSVTGKTGIVKYMTQKISSGHCNNCHGTNKIGVE